MKLTLAFRLFRAGHDNASSFVDSIAKSSICDAHKA